MIQRIKFILLVVVCVTSSCSKKMYVNSGEVTFLSSKNGTISVRSVGYGTNKQECINNAMQKSFNIIFFKGLPGSTQSTPLIEGKEQNKDKVKNYVFNLYSTNKYQSFVTSFSNVSDIEKINGMNSKMLVDMNINITALRRDLEDHDIIRKFGY